MSQPNKVSRRNFLKVTGIAAGAAAFSGVALPAAQAAATHAGHSGGAGSPAVPRGRMFFTNNLEFNTLSAASERIFPKDASGPGAKDLGVPYFIDNQLAGGWGYNAWLYMQGPYAPGAPTQGYQTALLRRDLFRQGLLALNTESNRRYKKNFPDLAPPQQDQILKLCEAGQIATEGFTSKFFFGEFKSAVLAGVYADPIYGGNNNMDGWRLKDYPGAQMSYAYMIEDEGFEKIDPMSLADMQ